MDTVAVASVLTSGFIAALTLITAVITIRGDRTQATGREIQKLVWEKKSQALLGLIKICVDIRAAIRAETEGISNEAFRQLRVLRVLNTGSCVLTPELSAFADKSVIVPAEQLHDEVERVVFANAWLLSSGVDEQLTDAQYAKEEAIDHEDFETAARHRDEERTLLGELGSATGLDLVEVDSLCDSIIAAARKDLRR